MSTDDECERLWRRYISREELSDRESDRLLSALENDVDFLERCRFELRMVRTLEEPLEPRMSPAEGLADLARRIGDTKLR